MILAYDSGAGKSRLRWVFESPTLTPDCMAVTRNGYIVFSCSSTNSIYCIHPDRSDPCELLAGAGTETAGWARDGVEASFSWPYAILLVESDHAAYVADFASIRHVTLPAHLF